MKLQELVVGANVSLKWLNPQAANNEISGLCDDSRKVKTGDLFFAISGSSENGNAFISQAKEKGAVAILSENDGEFVDGMVEDIKLARKKITRVFYHNPFESLTAIGVTGTNGKTTVCTLVYEILSKKKASALLGTISKVIQGEVVASTLTTPGILELSEFANSAREKKVEFLVMEASSHSLHQDRLGDLRFHIASFTNLSQDHFDYHGNMENYFLAKELLFTKYLKPSGFAVINIDDFYGQRLMALLSEKRSDIKIISISRLDSQASIFCSAVEKSENGIELSICLNETEIKLKTNLFGEFNIENALCAFAICNSLGLSHSEIERGITGVRIPGRYEVVYSNKNILALVDYAHTPDALERLLTSARKDCQNNLRVVFGCGGDRDRSKRPIMGAIAMEKADFVVVCSDNPRTEDPQNIIDEILAGCHPSQNEIKKIKAEVDREKAIEMAVNDMEPGDVLVIAGKGHENYQIIGTEKFNFDDRMVTKKIMEGTFGIKS